VNHSISEKNIAVFLSSPSKLIFHEPDNISAAISLDTYSHKALFNLFLCLFSIIYLNILERANQNISAIYSS
jgi:hypothetical protein